MKVVLYINQDKDFALDAGNKLISSLNENDISFSYMDNIEGDISEYCAILVVGGDGTMLNVAKFATENGLPVMGINAGKLGFLSEFEVFEIDNAVQLLKNNQLKIDSRITMRVFYNGQSFIALNDTVVQRLYKEGVNGLIVTADVYIDKSRVDLISGDGVIISTPTGSTAYSLSAGGPVLAPGISVFSITPISAHSLHNRPVIYSADSKCDCSLSSGTAGLFIDGKYISTISKGETITIEKNDKPMLFLRKTSSNFYGRLIQKLNNKSIRR